MPSEHTAGGGVLIEHGDLIEHICQIEGTAHTGRADTDNGDPLLIGNELLLLGTRRGNIAALSLELLLGDELLDLVDGDRAVDAAAGAGLLAAAVADAAADGGERIVLLYKLERVKDACPRRPS